MNRNRGGGDGGAEGNYGKRTGQEEGGWSACKTKLKILCILKTTMDTKQIVHRIT